MSIKIRKGNKTDHSLLHPLEWFNIMIIGVTSHHTTVRKKGKNNGMIKLN